MSDDRLESWKEIAAYLRRDVTTVQRWERREGMPVHRHVHEKAGSVHAFRSELDAWAATRKAAPVSVEEVTVERAAAPQAAPPRQYWPYRPLAAVGGVVIAAFLMWQLMSRSGASENPLTSARFVQLTNFDGNEQAAALSRDGRFVAFLSDRDGRMDVWVTQVGAGQFYNLTRGAAPELINPSVRTLGFTPDGSQVTFWTRTAAAPGPSAIHIWSVPVLGGPPRPYLEGVAELDWSADGRRVVYHTPDPGDPTFVRDAGGEPQRIFTASAGLHAHFPLWAPDGAFIYLVQGSVPNQMDIWRLPPGGGAAERITRHDSRVSHPVFVDRRTLLYLATDSDGSGPWIYALDINRREPRRVSAGLERYSSLSASADGQTLAATRADLRTTLWKVALDDAGAPSAAQPVPLSTGDGRAARVGPGYLLYVSTSAEGDGIWKVHGGEGTELWRAPQARITAAPAISPDGKRIAFCVQGDGNPALYVMNADGTDVRVLTRSLELHGAPAWTPDGAMITASAVVNGTPRLFNIPIDGGAPIPLVDEHATDPVWSPDGRLVVYSGSDIGTTFRVKAHHRAGEGRQDFPDLVLSRGSRHLAFMPGGRTLAMLKGEIGHKNVWFVDLETGAERQVTNFASGFDVHDFDISADGRELVVERLQEHADIVLIQRAR